MGGVDADHQHVVVAIDRLELLAEVLLVAAEGIENALPDAVERHVVVAGHRESRHLHGDHAVDECAGLAELLRLGPLGQVSGDDD
jgi:hypothetical protein